MTVTTTQGTQFDYSPAVVLEKEVAKEYFVKWVDNHIDFSVKESATLKECYDSYKLFSTENLNVIPVSKKAFAVLFRSHLEPGRGKGQIRIVAQAGVIIYGIVLKENTICD